MLESGLSGSVRGVPSNGHPYRDPRPVPELAQANFTRHYPTPVESAMISSAPSCHPAT
jgi:hypothetical protein